MKHYEKINRAVFKPPFYEIVDKVRYYENWLIEYFE